MAHRWPELPHESQTAVARGRRPSPRAPLAWIAPGGPARRSRGAPMIAKIVVALDGSMRAPGVFDAAAEVATRFGASLHPFRAIFVPPEFPAAAAGSQRDPLPEHLSKEAAGELVRLVVRAPHLAVAKPIVRVGQPWRLILEVADEVDADLIVLGSHGYHGWDRILGTTAARVANLAGRNVLVVHDRDGRAAVPPAPPPSSPYRSGTTPDSG
jgi:nucleotide-binding universal stress UspA family protein